MREIFQKTEIDSLALALFVFFSIDDYFSYSRNYLKTLKIWMLFEEAE